MTQNKDKMQEEICKSHKEAGVSCELCKEFNLSEKVMLEALSPDCNVYRQEDIKEFIKKLKELRCVCYLKHKCKYCEAVEELAGNKFK